MGFLTGRVTFIRYQVDGSAPRSFGPEQLDQLAERAIGKERSSQKDQADAGWIAGDDILDVDFDQAKNVVNDTLHFALRLDTQKFPSDLLRAYTRIELQALAKGNPSGHPSGKQKKAAREAARERLEHDAKDGRFTRRKAYPLLWDAHANHLLVGTTSANALDHAKRLFEETFGRGLTLTDAGRGAVEQGAAEHQMRPASFTLGSGPVDVAWVKDPASLNYLGNEFLLWLWFTLDVDGDTISLSDQSEVTVMMSRTLSLECPRGQSGSESIHSEDPSKLPETRRAVQAGKLPRQAGLILVRHGQQYELTLQAETLAVRGARLPPIEEGDERAKFDDRVGQVRSFIETLDLLYAFFLQQRLGGIWPKELKRMHKWLHHEEPTRHAATA
jgi:hypothetical protein